MRRHAPTPEWAGAGITLNAVAPGAIETPLLQEGRDHPTVGPLIDAFKSPLGRNGRPDEIAALLAVPARSGRAVLLRIDPVLRRRDGRAVPGRRLAPTLEALMATHDELDAIEQIKKLKARYFRCMDTKDWDGFQAVFAADATMDTTQEAPEHRGRAPARRRSGSSWRARSGPVVTVHHGHMPEIEITSPTTARGIWAMQDFLQMPEGSPLGMKSMVGWGHYTETYELVDGEWKIKTLVLTRLRRDVEMA